MEQPEMSGCFFPAMANQNHVEILKRGVTEWNQWREAEPDVWPDLLGAVFRKEKLDGVNLENTNLLQANLEGASLAGASLRTANLMEADLRRARLLNADLREANLYKANLLEADMSRASLFRANLIEAKIEGTRFNFATFGQTAFDHNLVLGGIGLDLIFHAKTAILDVQVFEKAAQAVRGDREKEQRVRWFFQNAGVTERIVKAALEALSQTPEWSSCFISYSHIDKEFVELLSTGLTGLGIPCFRDDQRFDVGARVIERVAGEIIRNDRTLLCCSWASLANQWVVQEAEVALEREEKQGKSVLVPLDIDGCLLENTYRPDGPPLAHKLRDRVIGDFRGWRNPEFFDAALTRLIETLRVGTGLTG